MAPVARTLTRALGSDRAALAAVVLVAALLRLAFLFRAPPFFVGGDSETYLQPAVELLNGLGFEPIAKRPPGYPLFVAGTLALLGFDLQALALVQHLLGVATSAAAWALGRAVFGRLAGLVAGLLTALNGPLLVFEHYVMAETLFTGLVAASFAALAWSVERGAWSVERPDTPRSTLSRSTPPFLAAGLLLGLATATRQTAQFLLPLAPLALLLAGWGIRHAARGTAVCLAGFAIVVLPWLIADFLPDRALAASTVGETLIWRLTRSDSDFFRGHQPGEALRTPTHRFAWEQTAGRELPSDVAVRLRQRFGLVEAEADRVLREVAVEAILQQPGRYLASSGRIFLAHLLGQEQYMGGQGKEGGRTRFANVESRYAWWDERARSLLEDPTAAQQNEFHRAQALAGIYQPHRLGWPLLGLTLLGVGYAVAARERRVGLVVGLAAVALVGSAALLAGDLPRYRYPADPLLAALQAGGAAVLIRLILLTPRLIRRHTGGQEPRPAGGARAQDGYGSKREQLQAPGPPIGG